MISYSEQPVSISSLPTCSHSLCTVDWVVLDGEAIIMIGFLRYKLEWSISLSQLRRTRQCQPSCLAETDSFSLQAGEVLKHILLIAWSAVKVASALAEFGKEGREPDASYTSYTYMLYTHSSRNESGKKDKMPVTPTRAPSTLSIVNVHDAN